MAKTPDRSARNRARVARRKGKLRAKWRRQRARVQR
jgi:hypothetical protein